MERRKQAVNSCNFIGRLTRDPEVRYSQGEKPVCVARFTLAVDRPTKKGNEREADFLTFKALGGRGEFVEKHLKKGMRIGICARAESGSYEKNGSKLYYTEFICEGFTFCDGKQGNTGPAAGGYMEPPEDYEGLPFN